MEITYDMEMNLSWSQTLRRYHRAIRQLFSSALPREKALTVLIRYLDSSGVYICKAIVNHLRHGKLHM